MPTKKSPTAEMSRSLYECSVAAAEVAFTKKDLYAPVRSGDCAGSERSKEAPFKSGLSPETMREPLA